VKAVGGVDADLDATPFGIGLGEQGQREGGKRELAQVSSGKLHGDAYCIPMRLKAVGNGRTDDV
jgi:hypothetical protein